MGNKVHLPIPPNVKNFSKCPGGASALSQVVVIVCLHIKKIGVGTIIASLPTLDAEELDRVRADAEAMSRRSETLPCLSAGATVTVYCS
jgi:hypothetical protein